VEQSVVARWEEWEQADFSLFRASEKGARPPFSAMPAQIENPPRGDISGHAFCDIIAQRKK
jgi:hypothetical protein